VQRKVTHLVGLPTDGKVSPTESTRVHDVDVIVLAWLCAAGPSNVIAVDSADVDAVATQRGGSRGAEDGQEGREGGSQLRGLNVVV